MANVEEDDDIQDYKRPWVGLTAEQIFACENSVPDEIVSDRDWCIYFARAIEARLKDKNND